MAYNIVVVDDEPLSLTNAKNILRANGMHVGCLRSGADLLNYVEKHTADLVLLDILMPGMDGFETYRALRQFEDKAGRPRVPVIFLTGEDNNETERRGLRAGASDFIHKPFDEDILIKRINNTIINSKTIESLTEEATTDRLTGCLNKAAGTERVSGLCRDTEGALMILDLDSFKLVNDIYGHDMGDRVLVAFADVLRNNIRSEDLICRIGGDEFMGFFAGLTGAAEVASFEGRLKLQFQAEAERLMGADHGIPLGVSIGVSFASEEHNDYQILFQYADSALYEVKRNGKHGFEIYDPLKAKEESGEDLERGLEDVVQIVSERGEGRGALLMGQDAFAWNYRFIVRYASRYGGDVTRMLFSLDSDEKGVIFTEMVSEFGNVLRQTLRKTDIVLQWQQKKYFVVLPMMPERDIPRVMERITEAWDKTGYHDRLEIKYAASMLKKG